MVKTVKKQDAGMTFAEHVARTRYQDIPPEALMTAKRSVLDTIGVTIAATGIATDLHGLVDLYRDMGGKPESTLLGFGDRLPVANAAFVNGAFSHALDLDDVHESRMGHPSAPIVIAALALAERTGKVTGKDLLTAVTLGQDVFCRLTSTLAPESHGWPTALTLGVFSVAAVCGKLLGYNEEQIFRSFGIAACRSGCPGQLITGEGSNLRAIYNSFTARDGLMAALLAGNGIGGISDVFEGPRGLFNIYFKGQYDREYLFADLGKVYTGFDVSFKAWPCCRWTHSYIEASMQIMKENHLKPADVKEITAFVGDLTQNLCKPHESRYRPQVSLDAKFSIPFTIGVALTKQNLTIRDFTPEMIKDKAVLDVADKVSCKVDPAFNLPHGSAPPGQVIIKTREGKEYIKRVERAYGSPGNPMDWATLVAKFKDCVGFSAVPISAKNRDKAVGIIEHLEETADVSTIVKALRPTKTSKK